MAAPSSKSTAKRRAHRFGLRAEWIAAAWLAFKGYRLLARRFSVSGGEIDIVARRGNVVAFVEVKARGDLEEAATAISETKRRRISRACRVWLTRNPWAAGATLRGDAILVAPGRLPRHLPAAYMLDCD
jgi:putative endonuclease